MPLFAADPRQIDAVRHLHCPSFTTDSRCIQTQGGDLHVSQVLLNVVEINDELAKATGIDLPSAVGTAVDSHEAMQVARKVGLNGSGYIKRHAGKNYLILKGPPGLRASLAGTRYLASNPKVANIALAAKSSAPQTAMAMAKAGLKRMGVIAIVAYTSIRVVQAILSEEDFRLTQLLGTITSDVTKFMLAAGAGALAKLAVGSLTTVFAGPLVAAIFVAVATSIVLDRLDREFELTDKLVRALDAAVNGVGDAAHAVGRGMSNAADAAVTAVRDANRAAAEKALESSWGRQISRAFDNWQRDLINRHMQMMRW